MKRSRKEPLESAITKRILRALREDEGFWVKIHGGPHQTTGLPDIVGCRRGTFYGLEVKRPSTKEDVTARQAEILAEIGRSGGLVSVVSSVEEALKFVQGGEK